MFGLEIHCQRTKTNQTGGQPGSLSRLLVLISTFIVLVGTAWAQQNEVSVFSGEQLDTDSRFIDQDNFKRDIRALLVPYREATLSSLVAARIAAITFKDGDRFKKGDTLVSFECGVLNAGLETAQARLKQYRLTNESNRELRRKEAVTRLDLALSEAKVEEGNAEVALAREQLKKCKVFAPYDGRVVKILANEFENVEVGDPLLSILDDSKLEMTLHIPSRWFMSISKDTNFEVALDETGKTYQAVITRISPKIDTASRTFEVTARIVGEHKDLLAGMSGIAIFGFQK